MPFFGAREKEILEREVGRSPSAERTVGLFTSAPTKAENNTELKSKECKFTGYARSAATGGTTWWNAASGESPATITNAKAITFAEWTAGADEKATHFVVFEGTAPVAFGALEATVTIGAGNKIASFAAGTLEATLT
jgi:hypothetical protein